MAIVDFWVDFLFARFLHFTFLSLRWGILVFSKADFYKQSEKYLVYLKISPKPILQVKYIQKKEQPKNFEFLLLLQ